LGEACIVNSNASVDHECQIGNGVHIAPGATLCGRVTVGDTSFIGAGSVILPRVKIGKNSIVGAGSIVTKNVPPGLTVAGNPAKFIN
jgi:acetyltransferase-like isoleucine patch superfamily enzyme